jgi:hypothetical protein
VLPLKNMGMLAHHFISKCILRYELQIGVSLCLPQSLSVPKCLSTSLDRVESDHTEQYHNAFLS